MSAFSRPAGPLASLKPRTAAFSLLEILVALVLIAVVMVIGSTVAANIRKSTGNAKCMFNLRTLGHAIAMYAAEHKGMVPPGRDYRDGFKYWFLTREMWPYQYLGRAEAPRFFRCPFDLFKSDHDRYYSYTWNVELLQDWPVKANARNPEASHVYLRDVGRKVLMADGASHSERSADPPPPGNSLSGAPLPLNPGSAKTAVNLSKRHHGGANCLMGDGSVQWYRYDEILTPALLDRR